MVSILKKNKLLAILSNFHDINLYVLKKGATISCLMAIIYVLNMKLGHYFFK